MFTIFKKEVRQFFSSLIGYIAIIVFLLMLGLFLWIFPDTNILDFGYANLDSFFNMAPYVFVFLIPAITMRSFADEINTGTIELLATRPVTEFQIIFGKYFAALLLVLFSILPTLIYFYSVYHLASPVGNVDTGGIWGSYFGLFFLGAVFVAIGLFCSSITSNQIVTFIIGVFLCLFLYAACAQSAPPDLEKRLADLDKATKSAQMAGDNAWMLTSAALVLMMTGPGLALFYGGLVRRKNVLSTMMHSFVLMAVVTMLWAVVGYSIAFAEGTPFFGDLRYLFLHGVGAAPNADYGRHHSAVDLHGLPVDVRHHHARAHLRRLRGTHEILGHAAVHHAVVAARLLPHGAHGVGQRRTVQRQPGRKDPGFRFRRRHGGAHHQRRLGA